MNYMNTNSVGNEEENVPHTVRVFAHNIPVREIWDPMVRLVSTCKESLPRSPPRRHRRPPTSLTLEKGCRFPPIKYSTSF